MRTPPEGYASGQLTGWFSRCRRVGSALAGFAVPGTVRDRVASSGGYRRPIRTGDLTKPQYAEQEILIHPAEHYAYAGKLRDAGRLRHSPDRRPKGGPRHMGLSARDVGPDRVTVLRD